MRRRLSLIGLSSITAPAERIAADDASAVVVIPGDTVRAREGVVSFRVFKGATAAQRRQVERYVKGCNEALAAGVLSPTGRVSTAGNLRRLASIQARRERRRAAVAGKPYGVQVAGHVPDTTWTGEPVPYRWMRLDANVNESLGSQAERYPIGFRPTGFIVEPQVVESEDELSRRRAQRRPGHAPDREIA